MISNIWWLFMSMDATSIVLAIATIVLAFATIILALETKRMRAAQTEPELFVNLEPEIDDVHTINFIICNIGHGAAYNIRFNIEPDYEYQKNKFLSQLSYINNGLSYLAPNQKIKSYLIWIREQNSLTFEELAKPFNITIKYENSHGKKVPKNISDRYRAPRRSSEYP